MRGSHRLPGLALGVLLAVVSAAACSRTPPEPAQQVTTVSLASSAPPAVSLAPSAGVAPVASLRPVPRCIRETPASPPPAAAPVAPGACPKDPNPHTLATVRLDFPAVSAELEAGAPRGAVHVEAEVARPPLETERGLMYRTKMPEDHGMLFDLGEHREHVFWMRNTCLPLDMLFVDDDGMIVGVLENVPTLNDEERTVGCPSSWVLEVNAGWARRHGVRAGQRMVLPPHG